MIQIGGSRARQARLMSATVPDLADGHYEYWQTLSSQIVQGRPLLMQACLDTTSQPYG
jgi:hypothetical protein